MQTNQSDDNFTFCFSNSKDTDTPYRERGRKEGYIPSSKFLIYKPNKSSFSIWNTLYFIMKHPVCVTVFFFLTPFLDAKRFNDLWTPRKGQHSGWKVLVSQILSIVTRRNKGWLMSWVNPGRLLERGKFITWFGIDKLTWSGISKPRTPFGLWMNEHRSLRE